MSYSNEWDLEGDLDPACIVIVRYIHQVIKQQTPELSEFFPFKVGYKSNWFKEGDFYCLRIEEEYRQFPNIGVIDDELFLDKTRKIFRQSLYPSFEQSFEVLNSLGYRFDLFTYVGKIEGEKLSWPHIAANVISWLNKIVLPRVIEMNAKRVTNVISSPPSFDTKALFKNIYVIESDSGMKQGTAFHLKDIGIITCDHCLRNDDTGELLKDVKIFRGNKFDQKKTIEIIKTNEIIDIALIKCSEDFLSEGRVLGSSDNLLQLDNIATAGFPNHNFGDNGFFSPGQITGFRMFSGLRHILVNSPIISGSSGGPAFDKNSQVVGVVVTGSDKMSKAHETEKHGLIPIEAILNFK